MLTLEIVKTMNKLEPIIRYKMTDLEAKAFKISLLWEKLSAKEFPNYSHVKLRKNGDPRKSILFRHCYKLVQETKDLIVDADYPKYITAQLHVYKGLPTQRALIDPIILTGEKAWRRWNFWKYIYKRKELIPEDVVITACPNHVILQLKKTRDFLFNQFLGIPDESQYKSSRNKLINWLMQDKISPYYAVLSPFFKRLGIETIPVDLAVYEKSITPEIETYFKAEFNYEYK